MGKKRLSGTLTIRLTSELRRRLAERSKALGQTPSAVARSTLEEALGTSDRRTLAERTGKHIGAIASKEVPFGRDLRLAMEDWNPDRRG